MAESCRENSELTNFQEGSGVFVEEFGSLQALRGWAFACKTRTKEMRFERRRVYFWVLEKTRSREWAAGC